ncbi:MAG: beta-galactosidase, partial [Acidobacteria bacterium]|nr:beta-galactosidase [Acidobacteriota bacterium]
QRPLLQDFLRRRYGTIKRYNAVHLTSLSSFEEVRMHARGQPPDALDRMQFCAERVLEQLRWRQGLVRQAAPRSLTFCHAGGAVAGVVRPPWVQEEVASVVDCWGMSQYEDDYWSHLLSAVVVRTASAGKPWGVVEMTGGSMWTYYPTTTRSGEELASLPLTFISLGATTNLFWQYRPERVGTESPNFGLVLENGRVPKRARAVGRLARMLRKHDRLLSKLGWPDPQIALVVDWHGFAMEESLVERRERQGADPHATRMEELMGINGALAVGGFEVSAVSSPHWEKHGTPPSIRLLILPCNVVLTDRMLDRLEQAAARGTSVLAGPMTGHYTGDGWLRTQSDFERLEKFFGSARCDFHSVPSCTLLPRRHPRNGVDGAVICEEYELEGARPWLLRGEAICGTRHAASGAVRWRWGSFLGKRFHDSVTFGVAGGGVSAKGPAAGSAKRPSLLPELLAMVAREAGIHPSHPSRSPFVIRVGRSDGKEVVFIRNTTPQRQKFHLDGKWKSAVALDGGAQASSRGQPLWFAPQETRVLLLD